MKVWQFQSSLNKGEGDPRIVGRIDTEAYYNSVRTADNVLSLPQGGLQKRPGMKYLGDALGDGRIENFSFNTEQNYLLVFTDAKMQIYKDGVLQANINGSGNDYVATPWSLAQAQEFYFIQSADTAIVVHKDISPRTIIRTGDTSWSIDAITFSNIPQWNFNDGSSPSPTSEVQDITINGIEQGSTIKLGLEGFLTDEFSYEGANSDMATAIQENLQALRNTASAGISVTYQSGGEFASVFRVTFSGDSAKDWRLITGYLVSGTVSGDETITSSRITAGSAKTEDAWSASRGYPRTATFHEGRLFFGGTRSLPSTVFGSVANDIYNFDDGKARDDEGVIATLDTNQVNEIRGIVSNQKLQIFTSGANFYAPNSPVTPSNIAFKSAANLGSRSVQPVSLDNTVLYAQRTGKAINAFAMTNEYQPTSTVNVAVLAPHLIKQPKEMAVSRGDTETDANYVYILNGDGSLTVLNTLPAENVEGFTRWTTSGEVKSVAVVDDQLYFLVKRSVNGADTYFIEVEDSTAFLDCFVVDTDGGDTIDASHLDTETVSIVADGAFMGTSTASSSVDVGRDGVTVYAGIQYNPNIVMMPLNVTLQNGPSAAVPKRIVRAALYLYESNGVICNGIRIADKTIGQNQFDAVSPITGTETVRPLGYSVEAAVTITQDTPMPFTLLSVGLEVKV